MSIPSPARPRSRTEPGATSTSFTAPRSRGGGGGTSAHGAALRTGRGRPARFPEAPSGGVPRRRRGLPPTRRIRPERAREAGRTAPALSPGCAQEPTAFRRNAENDPNRRQGTPSRLQSLVRDEGSPASPGRQPYRPLSATTRKADRTRPVRFAALRRPAGSSRLCVSTAGSAHHVPSASRRSEPQFFCRVPAAGRS